MDQITRFLAYVGPLLFIALKVGVVIGATGSAIEAVGLYFKLPRVEALGKALEAFGADLPKWIKNGWALLPDFVKKLIPFTPPAALVFLMAFASGYAATSCALVGAHGSAWPKLGACAPTPADLFSDVEDILLSGGDYEANLESLGKTQGFDFVECAAKAVVDALTSKKGATPSEAAGVMRGKAFLAKVSAQ